jgi:hypothetical protein
VHAEAFDELQLNVELSPIATAVGVAVNCTTGSALTVIATLAAWLAPPAPVQLRE